MTGRPTGKLTSREKGKPEACDMASADSRPDRPEDANFRPRLADYETAKPEVSETANPPPKPERRLRPKPEGNTGGSPLCGRFGPPPSRLTCWKNGR